MKKILCRTIADKGSVMINGVLFPNADDGMKTVVFTDEVKINTAGSLPWVDLRDTTLKIALSDCNPAEFVEYTESDLGCWMVEIYSDSDSYTVYIIKGGL